MSSINSRPNPTNADATGIREPVSQATLTIGPIYDGDVLSRDGGQIIGAVSLDYDELVKVSAADDAAGYLVDKLLVNTGLTVSIVAPGGDEQYQISLNATQATALLNVFTSSLKGLVPASGGNNDHYLRADGVWAAPPGSSGGNSFFPSGW